MANKILMATMVLNIGCVETHIVEPFSYTHLISFFSSLSLRFSSNISKIPHNINLEMQYIAECTVEKLVELG